MNELRKLFYLLLIIPIMFVNTGCSDDDDDDVVVNEAEVLAKYLEEGGNPVTTFPVMIKSTGVNTNIATNADHFIIDIRSQEHFDQGHIQGAVRVDAGKVLEYYEANNLASVGTVEIVCYSGQTAGWVTGLMHTYGYTNVKDMKYGMSSWNESTCGSWTDNISNARAADLVTTAASKAEAGDLPNLTTGKTDAEEILRARVEAVFEEGFGMAAVSNSDVFNNPSDYYIVNYWSTDHYNWGHIPGAIQYTPGQSSDLVTSKFLKTLPTDKKVAVYCYTGQTSAHVAAYLRVLGYDAKSIKFGVNAMAHDTMPGTSFDPRLPSENPGVEGLDIHTYTLVQ